MPPMWAWNRSVREMLWRRSFASKLNPPVVNPPPLRISYDREGELVDRVRELVRVPAVLVVAAVGVDRPEDPERHRGGDLVVEAVAGERRMVRLEVDPVLGLEAVAGEEPMNRRRVVVVLVLRRLLRLRLDQQRPLEPDLVLVLGDEPQEPRELALLALEVRVQQGVVALAAAPQDVVRAAEPVRDLEHVLDLGRGVGKHLGIRVRGRAAHVPRVPEQVRRAPQEPEAGPGHMPFDELDDLIEGRTGLLPRPEVRRDVAVVEREERDAELLEELEGRIESCARRVHRVDAGGQPGPIECPHAEHVRARPGERVPQADGDPEVVLHALAEHLAVRVVHHERERVGRVGSTERHPARHLGEERLGHPGILPRRASLDGLRRAS